MANKKKRIFTESAREFCGLYVVEYGGCGVCKVGITSDINDRMSALQCGTWHKVSLRAFYFPIPMGGVTAASDNYNIVRVGAERLEALCHRKMTDLDLHISGEFFDIDGADAVAVVKKVAKENDFRLATPHQILRFDPHTVSDWSERRAYHALANAAGLVVEYINKIEDKKALI